METKELEVVNIIRGHFNKDFTIFIGRIAVIDSDGIEDVLQGEFSRDQWNWNGLWDMELSNYNYTEVSK